MIYIGVDPGMTGAVAAIDEFGSTFVEDFATMEALGLFQELTGYFKTLYHDNAGKRAIAWVEKVGSMPGQGVSTTFKFGKAAGRVIGWLEALEFAYEEITPGKWQKLVFDSGQVIEDRKEASLVMARKLFPKNIRDLKRKKDHNRADALLIAEACRRFHAK